MKITKEHYKTYFKLTLLSWCAYFIFWLLTMFIDWDFIHPFALFLKIPIEDSNYRAGILITYLIIECIKITMVDDYVKSKNKNKK